MILNTFTTKLLESYYFKSLLNAKQRIIHDYTISQHAHLQKVVKSSFCFMEISRNIFEDTTLSSMLSHKANNNNRQLLV